MTPRQARIWTETGTGDGTGMVQWDEERHALGAPEMDPTHREFVEAVAALAAADDDRFAGLMDELMAHTREHFENEGRLMRACAFPVIPEHEGEHARVLADLEHLRRGVDAGRIQFARHYVQEGLLEWFSNHVATMDAALAVCLRYSRER